MEAKKEINEAVKGAKIEATANSPTLANEDEISVTGKEKILSEATEITSTFGEVDNRC